MKFILPFLLLLPNLLLAQQSQRPSFEQFVSEYKTGRKIYESGHYVLNDAAIPLLRSDCPQDGSQKRGTSRYIDALSSFEVVDPTLRSYLGKMYIVIQLKENEILYKGNNGTPKVVKGCTGYAEVNVLRPLVRISQEP